MFLQSQKAEIPITFPSNLWTPKEVDSTRWYMMPDEEEEEKAEEEGKTSVELPVEKDESVSYCTYVLQICTLHLENATLSCTLNSCTFKQDECSLASQALPRPFTE